MAPNARSAAASSSGFGAPPALAMSPSSPSSSSESRVTPSRPTICSAPCAWWKWVCENRIWFESTGFAAYVRSDASDFSSAWSISLLTQVSGPRSKSAAVLINLPRAVLWL